MSGRTRALAAAILALGLASPGEAGDFEGREAHAERGPVSARVRVEPAAPRLGDPIQLELEVSAEPGVELLMPEFGEALDRFTIVDFAPSETLGPDGGTRARQRYTLQASRSGLHTLPPLRVEFVDRRPGRAPAPPGEDAYELLTEPLEIEVQGLLPADAPLVLRAPLGALPEREPGAGLPWTWIAVGVAGLLAGLAAALWVWRREGARRRRQSAYALARAELDALLAAPLPGPEDMDPFFVALSNIVRRYLENRFGLRSPELTTEEFLGILTTSPDLSHEHRELLKRFLELSDLVKFAHWVPGPGDVEEAVRAARRFLDETRDDAPQTPRAGGLGLEGAGG